MRKITNLSMLALVSLTLAIAGCSKENGYTHPSQEALEGTNSITFAIATPAGDPITLRVAIHDQDEWEVKSLTMYQFNADGSKLTAIEEIDMTKLTRTADAEYTYTKEFTNKDAGIYRFLFVANDKVADATVGMTQADFEKKLMTQKLKADGTSTSKDLLIDFGGVLRIPMSGVATHGGSQKIATSGTTAPVKVELTRVVARVDVINHIPNLVITKIALRNTNDQTSVFPTKAAATGELTYEAPATVTKVAMAGGFADIPAAGLAGVATPEGAKLAKALYLYEGVQSAKEQDATAIVVTGKLGSTDVEYVIPFKKSEVGYDPVTVKRNYLYTLRLGDNTPATPDTNVKFTIEDTPWNAVTLNQELQVIRIDFDGLDQEYHKYFPEKQTLKVSNPSGVHYKFTLSTLYKEHTAFKVEEIANPVPANLTYTLEDNVLTLKVKQIDPTTQKAFEAKYKIWSDANPAHVEVLTFAYDPDFVNPDPAH